MLDLQTENRCLTCGYDLRGLPEPRCPECGRPCDALSRILEGVPPRPTNWFLRRAIICAGMAVSAPVGLLCVQAVDRTIGLRTGAWRIVADSLAGLLLILTLIGIPATAMLFWTCLGELRRERWYGNDKARMTWATLICASPFMLLAAGIVLAALRASPWFVVGLTILVIVAVLVWRFLK